MTRYRRFVLGAVAWVLVVTAGATLVWTVISDAGSGVAGELPTETPASTGGQSASERPSPSGTPSQSASAASASPSASPSARRPGRRRRRPPRPDQPTADPVRRSWRGAAGVVVAECRGGAITLVSAQPTSGWTIEVDDTGPDDLRVEFENADARVRVEATCAGGTPSFAVDSDGD